jgi:hypothetical protein
MTAHERTARPAQVVNAEIKTGQKLKIGPSRGVPGSARWLHEGKTREEVIENIKDAIALTLEDLKAKGG